MTRHLLKLVWNRKRSNALVIAEIFFSFLVLFGVTTMGMFLWDNSRRPLGFAWEPVWLVGLEMRGGADGDPETTRRTLDQLLREVGALPEVEAIATATTSPYANSTWTDSRTVGTRQVGADVNVVTLPFDRVFGTRIVAGRWFREGDDKLGWTPIVIDRDLAREAFGAADPLGRRYGNAGPDAADERVIGVVDEFRKEGELSARHNSVFYLQGVTGTNMLPNYLALRVAPGTTAGFERTLTERLRAVAPGWSFAPTPLANLRRTYVRKTLVPVILGSTLAFFFLLMVGLGLIGVLWQSVLRRTRELGLRRALGASRGAVLRQIVYEELLLTTLGVLAGALVAAQLPLLQVFSFLDPPVLAAGLAVAAGLLYLLALACALYPSSLAGRLAPADALRYE